MLFVLKTLMLHILFGVGRWGDRLMMYIEISDLAAFENSQSWHYTLNEFTSRTWHCQINGTFHSVLGWYLVPSVCHLPALSDRDPKNEVVNWSAIKRMWHNSWGLAIMIIPCFTDCIRCVIFWVRFYKYFLFILGAFLKIFLSHSCYLNMRWLKQTHPTRLSVFLSSHIQRALVE